MKELNKDDALRQSIIGIKTNYSGGGICRFENLTLDKLSALIDLNFIELDEQQNNSPTTAQIKTFMEARPSENVTAHGYLVSPNREDYRITLEGVEAHSLDKDFQLAFTKVFGGADEFECEEGYQFCWYD